jgi:hypothetical protein
MLLVISAFETALSIAGTAVSPKFSVAVLTTSRRLKAFQSSKPAKRASVFSVIVEGRLL